MNNESPKHQIINHDASLLSRSQK